MAAMRTVLAAICVLTLLATAYLSASLIIVRPPRANYPVWFTLATLLVAQAGLTLAALGTTIAAAGAVRAVVLAGGVSLGAVGVWMVRDTLTSSHFEGYELALGALLVAQGALTIGAFARRLRGGSAVRIT